MTELGEPAIPPQHWPPQAYEPMVVLTRDFPEIEERIVVGYVLTRKAAIALGVDVSDPKQAIAAVGNWQSKAEFPELYQATKGIFEEDATRFRVADYRPTPGPPG